MHTVEVIKSGFMWDPMLFEDLTWIKKIKLFYFALRGDL